MYFWIGAYYIWEKLQIRGIEKSFYMTLILNIFELRNYYKTYIEHKDNILHKIYI